VESINARKSKGVIRAAAVVLALVSALLFWTCKGLHKTALSSFVRSDLPMLDLDLHFVDLSGQEVPPNETRLAAETGKPGSTPQSGTEACPEIQGGDVRGGSDVKPGDKIPDTCPKKVQWYVKRHPIALSLCFPEPQKILSLLKEDGAFKEIWESKFVQGILYDPIHSAGIRAEDLGLQGLEGAFLARLAKEGIAGHGVLNYDAVHGKKGIVFSFVRDECPYASKALPVIARTLFRSGYRVPKLGEPIYEMRIGLQRIFITEQEGRIYVSNGLEGMLNVLESIRPPDGNTSNTPIVLTLRGEAFLDKLLEAMTAQSDFTVVMGFGLSKESPGYLHIPAGKYAKHLRPKVFKGVLASIPHDVFAALVTSFYLPPNMTPQEWKQLATEGPGDQTANIPEEGGAAVLWDLSSESSGITNIGIAIANQTTPDETQRFKSYFANPDLTATCGGGTVLLASTSQPLLTRMKEACERQSLSILDWERGAKTNDYDSAQIFLFMNPGTGMKELFLAGGAKSDDQEGTKPQWKEHYERAKAAMREDSERLFGSLPVFAYSGSAAPSAREVQLKEFKVQQGAPQ